jgi:hypothetical protein
VDKTVIAQLKAIELMGRAQGLWEGNSTEGRDRLNEILTCWQAGPVERGSQSCVKCKTMNSTATKFCGECGTLIERDKTPSEMLTTAKKKAGAKEVIQ